MSLPTASTRLECKTCRQLWDERLLFRGHCPPCQRARRDWWEAGEQMRRQADIPERFAHLSTWDDLQTDLAGQHERFGLVLNRLREFLNDPVGSVFVMTGTRGSGKTSLACVAVRLAIARRRPARFTSAAALLRDLKGRFSEENGEEAWLNEWAAPWLLVVDEFAERSDSDWSSAELTNLIDARHGAMRKTVLLANLTRDEFKLLAGGSITDRAYEGAGGIFHCDWPSFRLMHRADRRGES